MGTVGTVGTMGTVGAMAAVAAVTAVTAVTGLPFPGAWLGRLSGARIPGGHPRQQQEASQPGGLATGDLALLTAEEGPDLLLHGRKQILLHGFTRCRQARHRGKSKYHDPAL